MAGIGSAPKDKSERRRRNEPARGEWIDLAPLEAPVLPELPPLADDEEWPDRTKLAWAAWRTDPVTAMYSPADISYALDLAILHAGMTASTANEVRLRMDGLGLTPKGKKDNRWRVVDDALEQSTRPAARRSSSDRRARLSVVK